MIGLFHRLLGVLGFKRPVDCLPPAADFAPPLAAPWTQDDRLNWARIIQSPAGAALLRRGYAHHYQMLHDASLDADPRNRVKVAHGFHECLIWMVSLSSVENESRQTNIDAAGEPVSDEMRDYLARVSP